MMSVFSVVAKMVLHAQVLNSYHGRPDTLILWMGTTAV